jgi:prepilin-type processing-associated H-X9-DG protein
MELVIVLAVLFLIGVILFPRLTAIPGDRHRSNTMICIDNLRQIDSGFLLFANDHHGLFPMQLSVTNDGTMGFIISGHTFPHFEKLKNYGVGPRSFICPIDVDRRPAANNEAMNDANVSYFLNFDAALTNNLQKTILAGDRFLQTNGRPIQTGLFVLTTNLNVSWPSQSHGERFGNLAFADGHVEMANNDKLSSVIQAQPLATNRLCIP